MRFRNFRVTAHIGEFIAAAIVRAVGVWIGIAPVRRLGRGWAAGAARRLKRISQP